MIFKVYEVVAFILEVLVKVVAEGDEPWQYLFELRRMPLQVFGSTRVWTTIRVNKWNTFDFMIVLLTLIFGERSAAPIFRLVRLLRVFRLFNHMPQLQVIVMALMKGLNSIWMILLLLAIIFYIFAVMGTIAFAENDPTHFSTLPITMVTLFQFATLESWASIMWLNFYGCEDPEAQNLNKLGAKDCISSHAQPVVTSLYCITFIVVGSYLLLTLFVGVVTAGMEEATQEQLVESDMEDMMREVALEYNLDHFTVSLWRQVFNALDIDDSGEVHEMELQISMTAMGRKLTKPQIAALLNTLDMDASGGVNFPEFLRFMLIQEERTREMGVDDGEQAAEEGRCAQSKMDREANTATATQTTKSPPPNVGTMLESEGEEPSKVGDKTLVLLDSLSAGASEDSGNQMAKLKVLMARASEKDTLPAFIEIIKQIDIEIDLLVGKNQYATPKNRRRTTTGRSIALPPLRKASRYGICSFRLLGLLLETQCFSIIAVEYLHP